MANSILPPRVVERLGEVSGAPVVYPADCDRLSSDISRKLNETIGVTTLKRLFGFAKDAGVPRLTTLDILARYAGFDSYQEMIASLYPAGDSEFEVGHDIHAADLQPGQRIRFTYLPDREVTVEFIGDKEFRVTASKGSRLKAGDTVRISGFYLGHPLIVESVMRDGEGLGRYVAGKASGLISLSLTAD